MTLTLEKTKSDLNIGISERNRESVVKILNTFLPDEYILYTKTRNYHVYVIPNTMT
jgi:starvation-inducible DNA-binding protein